MAGLTRLRSLVRPLVAQKSALEPVIYRTYAGAWNQDWRPGPFPKTPEERAAAAKKYGLRPEDYEPYPDDGYGQGDYPNLPLWPANERSEFEAWDIPEMKRNFGEPMHVDADYMTEDKFNPYSAKLFSFRDMLTFFCGISAVVIGLYVLSLQKPLRHPVMPKQYPTEGVKHYTFEPAE